MDTGFVLKLENPKKTANCLSKLFFVWMIRLCRKGAKQSLEIADLYKPLTSDESARLTDALERNWRAEVDRCQFKIEGGPSLTRAIAKTFFWKYMGFGILLFLQYTLRASQPVVLAYFINLFSEEYSSDYRAMLIFGAVLTGQSFITVFMNHHIEFGQASIGMRARIAVSSLVYRKMLKLSHRSLGETASGMIVNLLSNDVGRFDLVASCLHYFWIVPIQVVLVSYLIWREVQIATLAGVLTMVMCTLPVQGYLGTLTSKLRLKTAMRTDYRVKLMNEIITGIQVIKMYAWEKPFEEIVKLARKKEINVITTSSYLRAFYMSAMVFIERMTLFLTVACYVLLGNVIRADQVFSMAQFYNILQLGLAILLPMAVSFTAESSVSVKRLQSFLVLEEKAEITLETPDNKEIIFDHVNAAWSTDKMTVENFDFTIPQGSLCAIVGPVGAGKTSVLQVLLKELPILSGSVKLNGKLSYAAQEPWLFGATVRNNILFGKEYNKLRYKNVIHVCALRKDFEQFPQGDKTIVGERGVSLSGGQRARINLARAVYSEADIYLFDDPLSAVDTHVGKHLFEKCILQYLAGTTRILVTHQLQYLKASDLIIVINDGRIEAQGTFEELSSSNMDFTKLLIQANESEEKEDTVNLKERKLSIMSHKSNKSESSKFGEAPENIEEMQSSDSKPFMDYLRASGNNCARFTIIFILALSQMGCSGADYWVTYWTQQEQLRTNSSQVLNQTNRPNSWLNPITEEISVNNRTMTFVKREMALYIYTGLICFVVILTLMRSFGFFKMAMYASRKLHRKMFHALLRTPMRFFDTNPSGRVLNRFSKDMGAIDEFLPRALMEALQIFLVMCGILAMVLVANYYMIVPIIVFGGLFLKVRALYIATAKDVKHLEGITKSPVFSHLNSSLNGITTIRASQAETVLAKEFDKHQDIHTSAWFLTIASRVCFGLWLDLISCVFVAIVIFSFILLNYYANVSGSLVGLAISQALILTGMLQHGIRQTAEVVNQLTSVDRVMQYTRLDSEFEEDITTSEDPTWPDRGLLEFRSLSLRYSPLDPPVLQNLNIYIAANCKVGIVGRTGAGKSSLISALFRLAPIEGSILVDGVDTKNVKLKELRKKISIIPQEPILFSASIRYNLDPFNEFEDGKLWEALDEVELEDSISSLDFKVSEGGSNFSVGQRQLVCLARAILRNNKMLILDEATANVDPRTDSLIQNTIRRKFQNCTVLTIAHRLNTIMDSDKILVMDSGRMVEFEHPHILLEDADSYFSKLVAETGAAMAQQLKEISKDCYLNNAKNKQI